MLNRDRLIDREQDDGFGGWLRCGGIGQKCKRTHRDGDQGGDCGGRRYKGDKW